VERFALAAARSLPSLSSSPRHPPRMKLRVEWFGHSAFRLSGGGSTVVLDPFGEMDQSGAGELRWGYPPIPRLAADLVLISHEHPDHNGLEAVGGAQAVIRSTAGRFDSPIGEVIGVASEHDQSAGTERGPNTIFVFSLGGLRVCHFGDFGQAELRAEQQEAIDEVDLLFLPVGDGPTIGARGAVEIARRLAPAWVVPMHYRTAAIDFLEPAAPFFENLTGRQLRRPAGSAFEIAAGDVVPAGGTVLLPKAPGE
jgi:L-ascorbate metabolism protein UlaG (beta-lactamase superfamily)